MSASTLKKVSFIVTLQATVLVVLALCWPGCHRSQGLIVGVAGSTSVQPFAEMLAEDFKHVRPDLDVEVSGGGSTQGVRLVSDGVSQIGMCSRELKAEEAQTLTPIVIARDGLAVVVHPSNPVAGLSRMQIRDIFNGRLTNWSQVGGADRPIRLVTREEGSGTREAFAKLVMEVKDPNNAPSHDLARISRKALTQESNGAVKELVRNDPAAIGYMSMGLVGHELKALSVDGAEASIQAVQAHKYPLVRPFLFVVKGTPGPAAQAFIDFVLSDRAQNLLVKEGLVRAQ